MIEGKKHEKPPPSEEEMELLDAIRKLDGYNAHYTLCEVLREIHKKVKNSPELERRVVLCMLFAKRMDRELRRTKRDAEAIKR